MLLRTPFNRVYDSIPQKSRYSAATTHLPFPSPQKSHIQSEENLSDLHQRPPVPTGRSRRQKNGLRSSPLSNLLLSPSGFNPERKKRKDPSLRTTGVLNGITLGHRGHKVISQVGDSVALVRSSEEDVYYRNDSMTVETHELANGVFCHRRMLK